MAIHSKATPSEEVSPYYRAHQRMAEEWEAYAKEIGADISGEYNAWHVNLALKSGAVSISGTRQLTTVTVDFIPLDGRYQESLEVRLNMPNKGRRRFTILKRTALNIVQLVLKGFRRIPFDRRYSISPAITTLDQYTIDVLDMLIQYDLRQIVVDSGIVWVQLGTFPQSAAVLKGIINKLRIWNEKIKLNSDDQAQTHGR